MAADRVSAQSSTSANWKSPQSFIIPTRSRRRMRLPTIKFQSKEVKVKTKRDEESYSTICLNDIHIDRTLFTLVNSWFSVHFADCCFGKFYANILNHYKSPKEENSDFRNPITALKNGWNSSSVKTHSLSIKKETDITKDQVYSKGLPE